MEIFEFRCTEQKERVEIFRTKGKREIFGFSFTEQKERVEIFGFPVQNKRKE